MLQTPLDRLLYIIEKAREYDVATAPLDLESGSNPSDDGDVAILEDTADNPTREELAGALDTLNEDQRIEIIALIWLGRGDFDRAEWAAAVKQARELHGDITTEYLIGTPLLADYLEEAISALGYSLEDEEKGRL
jgi:hypothetical protein